MEANIYYSDGLAYEADTEDARVEKVEVKDYPATMFFKEERIQLIVPVLEGKRIYCVRGEGVDKATVLYVTESMNIQ